MKALLWRAGFFPSQLLHRTCAVDLSAVSYNGLSWPLCHCLSFCAQVLYSIPGADITNNPSLLATFVLNLIFIFGLLVSNLRQPRPYQQQQQQQHRCAGESSINHSVNQPILRQIASAAAAKPACWQITCPEFA
jgi:hypothetical protein